MTSVRDWCSGHNYEYRFIGDELFELIAPALLEKLGAANAGAVKAVATNAEPQKIIATDLARLMALKNALNEGYDRVVWLDADFLIFAPEHFKLPELWQLPEGYMLGREVWVQADPARPSKLRAYVKVHNAFLLFDRGNSFLDFYMDHAERLLDQCQGPMPAQFIGPKLLTALHNVVQCPVMESAGMLSPEVIRDLLSDGARLCALQLMRKRSVEPLAGANLCSSLAAGVELSDAQMQLVVQKLISDRACI